MMKAVSASLALLFAASAVAPATAAQQSRYERQDRFVANYCDTHRGDRDCRDWQDNRHSWNEGRYRSWYRHHRHEFGPDDAAAAIFGFVAGAATAAVAGAAETGHRAACEAQYRSYDWNTDMYRGFDGEWHRCRL
jgi:hypothetical protein